MALTVIFCFLMSFLSVYGFVSLTFYLRNMFSDMKVMKGKTVFTVVAVKNEEERVEGIIKTLLLKNTAADSGLSDSRVIAVDMGSSDKTADIITKISNSERAVTLMNFDELKSSLEQSI